ncbi:MAG: alpha-L-fucosidase [Ferruginibacter sp.]
MKLLKQILVLFFTAFSCLLSAQTLQPKPTSTQLDWHDMEFYLFMHFGPNTFTDLEWGHGNEKAAVFNPTNLDCEQWCRIAKAAGAKGIIITAKHHDGFCLWPSKFSKHTVRESKWRDGNGDVLKELSAACKKYGLKFGVYISPWDRNHPDYGTENYNDVFVGMMKELFTNYGPIWELWWDGANGEGPNGKRQVYDWKRFERTVRDLSPGTLVFSDIGPDIRWVGNEQGFAGKTNWNTLDTAGFTRGAGAPSQDTLNTGNIYGKNWIPAECDVSIRPGWFYHKAEDSKVKTPAQLFDLYLKSVGRGANLLLNVPPDRSGLINENDSAALVGLKNLLSTNFTKSLVRSAHVQGYFHNLTSEKTAALHDGNRKTFRKQLKIHPYGESFSIEFKKPQFINCIVIQEHLNEGQNCSAFSVSMQIKASEKLMELEGTTIGRKRILTFPKVEINSFTLYLNGGNKAVAISEIEAYLIDEKLIEK